MADQRKLSLAGGQAWSCLIEEVGGDFRDAGRVAKMLRRGGARGPELHPFYPLSQLFCAGPLPSYFLTSFFCLPLLFRAYGLPGPHLHSQCCSAPLCHPKLPLPSLFGVQVKGDRSQRCSYGGSLALSLLGPSARPFSSHRDPHPRRVGAGHGEQQCIQSYSCQIVCAECICPLALS